MTNKDVNKKIDRAFENACPDILDNILDKCDTQKGTVIKMKKAKNNWLKPLISAAAVFAIVFSALGFYNFYSNNKLEKSVVSLDVNPSIEISLNNKDRVLKVSPQNSDAEKVLEGMDLANTDLDVAINAIIGSMVKKGYISELANSVLISIDSNDPHKSKAIEDNISVLIGNYLKTLNLDGAIVSQRFDGDELEDIKEFAKEHNISEGKAKYIFEIKKTHPEYDEDDLAKLSINDINLIANDIKSSDIQKHGNASNKSYIGEDKAIELAKSYAKIGNAKISKIKVEMEYEHTNKHPVMVYEVEITVGNVEYEIKIDAKNGKLIEIEKDIKNISNDKDDNDNDKDDIIPSGNYISKSEAIKAALNHAGIANPDKHSLKAELEKEDGKVIYEVEFIFNKIEYEYEIDAKTKKIISFDKELCDKK